MSYIYKDNASFRFFDLVARHIDYIIDHAEDKPTEALIKELHRILKTGTSDSRKDWFNVGDYKRLAGRVNEYLTDTSQNYGIKPIR